MTSLDVRADRVRARAAAVPLPKLSTILVTLFGLVPFLLGWVVGACWQLLVLLWAASLSGWETAQAQMGPRRPPGGS